MLLLLVVSLAASVVAVRVDLRDDAVARLPARGSTQAVLRIMADPRPSASQGLDGAARYVVSARLESAQVRGRERHLNLPVTVLAGESWAELPIGATVTARVKPRPTERGDAAAVLLIGSGPPEPRAPPPRHLELAGTLRTTLNSTVSKLPDHARALIPGIAVGDDRALDPALADALRVTSLTHLTAVSGAHVALVLAPVLLATGMMRRGVRVAVSTAVLVALVVLVRPEPSVIRAAAMGAVTIGAMLTGRPAAAATSLSVTVLVLLLADPWLASSYGFTLSVLATGALCLLAPVWARGLDRVMPKALAAGLATTAAAQTVCAPVLVLLDPRVSTLAVPANLLAAPAVAPVTFLGLAATLLGPVAPDMAVGAARLASPATAWIAGVASVLAGAPGSTLPWAEGAPGALLLATVSVLVVAFAPRAGMLLLRGVARVVGAVAWRIDEATMRLAGRRAEANAGCAENMSYLESSVGGMKRYGKRNGADSRIIAELLRLADSNRRGRGGPNARRGGIGRGVSQTMPYTRGRRLKSRTALVLVAVLLLLSLALWLLIGGAGRGGVFSLPSFGGAPRDWALVQCDVGQGSATLVRTGPNSAIALDVGPPVGSGRGETQTGGISRCVHDARVDTIDLLVITHTHLDHAGGLDDLLDAASVSAAVIGPGPKQTEIHEALTQHGAEIHAAHAGTTLTVGEVRLDVLQGETEGIPAGKAAASAQGTGEEAASENEEDVNGRSLVVLATLPGGVTHLTMGDLGEPDQDRLLGALERNEPELLLEGIDVVAVPHHGSADQSARLAAALRPRLALVSVGSNGYGHPTDSALRLYEEALVRRTDECGATYLLVSEGRAESGPGDTGDGAVTSLQVVDACS